MVNNNPINFAQEYVKSQSSISPESIFVIFGNYPVMMDQISGFYLHESIFKKLPDLSMTLIDKTNGFMKGWNLDDYAPCQISFSIIFNKDDSVPMNYRLMDWKIEPNKNMVNSLTTVSMIPDLKTFFGSNSLAKEGTSNEAIQSLARLHDIEFKSHLKHVPQDGMKWLMLHQTGFEFINHVEKRAKISNNDYPIIYFDRKGVLNYSSALTAANSKTKKYNFIFSSDEISPEIVLDGDVSVGDIRILNKSAVLNNYIGYNINQIFYDDSGLYDINTNNNLSTTITSNINKNKEFIDNVSGYNYAGHDGNQSGNTFTGINERRFLNNFYKINYFNEFISVSIQLKSQNDTFLNEKIDLLDKVTLNILSDPSSPSYKYSGDWIITGILWTYENQNTRNDADMIAKVVLGRNGNDDKLESIDPGTILNSMSK